MTPEALEGFVDAEEAGTFLSLPGVASLNSHGQASYTDIRSATARGVYGDSA